MSVFPAVDLCGKRPVWSVKTWPVAGTQNAYRAWLRGPVRSGGGVGTMLSGMSGMGVGVVSGLETGVGCVDPELRRTWSRWPCTIAAHCPIYPAYLLGVPAISGYRVTIVHSHS